MLIFRRRRLDANRAREFAEAGRRLMQERKDAPAIVDPLLENTARTDWPALAERLELQSAGALERLGNLFAAWLPKDTAYAKAIADLAVSVAEAMPHNAYDPIVIGQLRAHAWKDLGKALRFLGRNEEALEMFETAERYLDCGSLAHDRAIVRFNLAMSLQELQRFVESQHLLAESKQVFREHGDKRNAILCGLAEGVLLQRLKRFREAREIYLLLLASFRDIDLETLASIHHTIGLCSIELGDYAEADHNFLYALSIFREQKQSLYVSQVELGRGRLFIRRGNPAKGIAHLRLVRLDFLRHSMHEEAGICGLEMVEGHLLLDQPEKAETLARTIVGEFAVAGLNERAITALGYLSEAIAAKKAPPALVTYVREYIVSLRTAPERDFARPTLTVSAPE